MLPRLLGTFKYKRSTPRYHVYSRINEDGRDEAQYANKKSFGKDDSPESIEVLITW